MTAQDNTNGVTWSGSWNGPNCNCSGNSTITADAECKCPPGKKWAPQANTCVPTVDKEETRKELYCPACPTAEAPPPTEDGFGNPIFPLTGAKREFQRTGISIGGIELRLTYDTTQRLPSDVSSAPDLLREPNSFGVLWKSNLHHTLQVATNLKGAMLTRGNGLVINFTGNGSGAFTPDTGNAHKLVSISGGYRFTDDITGAIETFDSNGKLTSLAAADGNVLTFTYSGGNLTMVQAADGRLVRFTYNGSNLITQLVGTDAGSITVAYDGANNLTSLTWQDGKVLTFVYGESGAPAWALTGKVDENSSRLATFGYDAQGRATSTEYAGVVNKYSVIYSSAPIRTYTEVYNATDQVIYRTWRWQLPSGVSLTRPNGESSSIEVVDAAGTPAISSMNQSAGSGSTAATMATVYDSQGNKVTQDNYQGERTCRVFDSNRREIVRVEGLANTVACSSVTPHGAALPAGARKYTTTWHADWRLPTKRVGPLSQTTHIYQGQPDPFNSNVAANCATAASRADGKPLPLRCKSVDQALLPESAGGTLLGDDNFSNVVLLMHGDGTNGSTTMTDKSAAARVATVYGNASIATAQKKFGTGSIAFDGAGDYLIFPDSPDFAMGTGDFTVEFWVWTNPATSAWSRLVENEKWNVTGGWHMSFNGADPAGSRRLGLQIGLNGGGGARIESNAAIPTLQWVHVAIARAGTAFRMFINGTLQSSSITTSENYTSQKLRVGVSGTIDGFFTGYIDDLRVTKGLARYTSSFTPSTLSFPDQVDVARVLDTGVANRVNGFTYDAAGRVLSSVDPNSKTTTFAYYPDVSFGGTDAYAHAVSLLLSANGTDGSTTVVDRSANALSPTVFGNAQVSTAQSKFGGSSLKFDGNGDYLTYADNDAFELGGGDFTLEAWVRFAGYPSSNAGYYGSMIVAKEGATGKSWSLIARGTASSLTSIAFTGFSDDSNYTSVSANHSFALNTWYHIAATRTANKIYLFVDGNLINPGGTSMTRTFPNNGTTLRVGALVFDSTFNYYFNGNIDDLRITKGVARYTANFTAPTQEFSNTGPSASSTGYRVGDLQSVTNAAGHVTTFNLYDPAGRVRQMTDPKSVVTDITYTPRGWISTVTVTPPGGSGRLTTYTYDDAGQLTGVASPDGTSVTYTYDAAHRLTGATDAKGNAVTYTLDNVGNRIAEEVRDPTGTLRRSISRSFDALNRLQQVTGAAR